jgi:hypothetical protein
MTNNTINFDQANILIAQITLGGQFVPESGG